MGLVMVLLLNVSSLVWLAATLVAVPERRA